MRPKHILKIIVLIVLAIGVAGSIAIIAIGLDDKIVQCDVGIVLGNHVNDDGQPSKRLAARLDKAAELYTKGIFNHIIVSGGHENVWDEAIVMREYLVAHNVPAQAIILDGQGINTDATGRDSVVIMKKYGFKSAMAITQYFHIYRTEMVLRHYGIAPVYNAHASFFELLDIYSLIRELFAIPVYWVRYHNEVTQ